MVTKSYHYFLPIFGSWPFLLSLMSFNFFFSVLTALKFSMFESLFTSIVSTILGSFLWWGNYKKEFSFEGLNSKNLEASIKMSMIFFIASEIFFFFSFFWSYFHYFLSPSLENGFEWPPLGILAFDALNVPFLNTLILLSSGGFVTLSHLFLIVGKLNLFNLYLFFTLILGVIFTSFQALEYHNSFFSISDGSYGSSFFILTGFHGIHVVIGSVFLMINLVYSYCFNSKNSSFLGFELASWYWHFVDVVWIFLFFFLYFLNN